METQLTCMTFSVKAHTDPASPNATCDDFQDASKVTLVSTKHKLSRIKSGNVQSRCDGPLVWDPNLDSLCTHSIP